jgi:hypothetical protein
MSKIVRVVKNGNYSVINNEFLNSPELSWKAKGILAYLLSKPDGWTARIADLKKKGRNGRDSVRSGMTELEEVGYLFRNVRKDAKGRFNHETVVYEKPQKPATENPSMDNPTVLSTELVSTQLDSPAVQEAPTSRSGQVKKTGKTPNPNFRPLTDHWVEIYSEKYGIKPVWDGGRRAAVSRLLDSLNNDLPKAKAVLEAFLADDETWNLAERRHNLTLLQANLEKYLIADQPHQPFVYVPPVNNFKET